MRLRCDEPGCGAIDAADLPPACPRCGGLLELEIAAPREDPEALQRLWRERRASDRPLDASGVWRYRELLPPFLWAGGEAVTLAEGNTPLLPAPVSAAHAGLRALRIKHLGWNPTGSFKDAGMTVAITQAKQRGARRVACASTGNTAASMAAYAARAGLPARVYLPAGGVTGAKLAQAIDCGAEIVEVEGNFDTALDGLLDDQDRNTCVLNSVNPFRLEGQKTAVVSLLEQIGWQAPDFIVLPGGNLGNAAAFGKALEELSRAGFIGKVPRLGVVQAAGASPFVRTWRAGGDTLQIVADPRTAASAIRIGAPRSWKRALRALAFTRGVAVDVSEEEIAGAKAAIGCEGVGCEPASAAALAGARRLVADGTIDRDADVIVVLTGHALKDPEYRARAAARPGAETAAGAQAHLR